MGSGDLFSNILEQYIITQIYIINHEFTIQFINFK